MGTSLLRSYSQSNLTDHPHAYGDKHIGIFEQGACQGSSPRVWGQAARNIKITENVRIIPTRMGTSADAWLKNHRGQDHPHAYGDKQMKIS